MSEEREAPEVFNFPFSQKDAWNLAFKLAFVAAYFWLFNHFVTIEQHEKDLSKIDTRQAMIEKTLSEIDHNVTKVTQEMEDEHRYHTTPHP